MSNWIGKGMNNDLAVLSLFTGAGGLDLGLERAGFETRLCVENDARAQATLRLNRPRWTLAEPSDAIEVARDPLAVLRASGVSRSEIVLLAGGPPCQPFSMAGNWTPDGPARMRDPRAQTIRAYLRILHSVRPEVLLFENVAGFAFKGRHQGFRALVRGIREINRERGTRYAPQLVRINSADYGVPQLRERVFVVAHRDGRILEIPQPTHGPKSVSGQSYRTAWDAIGDLDISTWPKELELQGKWAALVPSIPEGRNYLWHTSGQGGKPLFGWRTRYWSFLLKLAKNAPAWTIPASPGPATGPFHWQNRMLSAEEMCRIQTFPADFVITDPRRAAQHQIGNAVPPALAELLGKEIRRQLLSQRVSEDALSLIPASRVDCPSSEKPNNVPQKFLFLVGNHKAHPGEGKGPGRRESTRVAAASRVA
jgi:DNA (cytosine-5)-methyltransferase 1